MSFLKNITILIAFLIPNLALAQQKGEFPNIEGEILFESISDHILSTSASNVKENSSYVNVESYLKFNINQNWSIISNFYYNPFIERNANSPERTRSILSDDRKINFLENGIILEEIKLSFENDDLRFSAGKFNPEFGSIWQKKKKTGIFTTKLAEEYELREKIGVSLDILFDDAQISLSSFFSDNTDLSDSALFVHRGSLPRSNGQASNTSTLSSYTITAKGQDPFDIENLYYNIGYRYQDTDNITGFDAESGYVIGLEYLYELPSTLKLIPVGELVVIDNFTGFEGVDASYFTLGVVAKYQNWNFAVTNIDKRINNTAAFGDVRDYLFEILIGYQLKNGIKLDVSRADFKQDKQKGEAIALMMSYIYQF